jgi:very-short-patch-repair endonuclease
MTIQHSPQRQPERIQFARDQRRRANEFAQDVWQMLRGRRLLGEKFRREHPIGPYTVDFVCLELRLVVEVDGKDHFTQQGRARDALRDAYLRSEGFEVLRIEGFLVTQDPIDVREEIEAAVKERRGDQPAR